MKSHPFAAASSMKHAARWLRWSLLLVFFTQLVACSSIQTPASCHNAESADHAANNRYANPSTYTVKGHRYHVLKTAKGYDKVGYASWYGKELHGHRTFNDERYNMYAFTAASTTLPIPCYVRVINLENGRSVVVRINDRGPFRNNRIIDLSYAAAKELGYSNRGTVKVRVTAL